MTETDDEMLEGNGSLTYSEMETMHETMYGPRNSIPINNEKEENDKIAN